MPLAGKQLQAREIAALADAALKDIAPVALIEAVAVCLAESMGYEHAWHDNLDTDGKVLSRDVGLWQINVPASDIGRPAELSLYDPEENARRMALLYESRGWQPWASYNSTIYLYDRFIGASARGVGNYLADELLKRPCTDQKTQGPYVHAFTTPVLDLEFRVGLASAAMTAAEHGLGWTAKSAEQVGKIHKTLAIAQTAMKSTVPPS